MSSALHFDIERHLLPNGLKVILQQDRRAPLVAINLWYHVGSKNERPGQTGFAHLFEHMLFQGSAHVGTNGHFQLVQEVGGTANGSTWYDRTNYFETPAGAPFRAGALAGVGPDGLPAAGDDPGEARQPARGGDQRAPAAGGQPALWPGFRAAARAALPGGAILYRWPVIGYVEDLEAATLAMVERLFTRFYLAEQHGSDAGGRFREGPGARPGGGLFSGRSRRGRRS